MQTVAAQGKRNDLMNKPQAFPRTALNTVLFGILGHLRQLIGQILAPAGSGVSLWLGDSETNSMHEHQHKTLVDAMRQLTYVDFVIFHAHGFCQAPLVFGIWLVSLFEFAF